MYFSIAMIILCGLFLGSFCKKLSAPALFGMILAGIAIGPKMGNLIDLKIIDISTQIRKMALVLILIRAGLKLTVDELKENGRGAVLLCFLPACFEIFGVLLFAPLLLNMNIPEALLLGAILSAVSPAVVVPRMVSLIDNKYGTDKKIPQMILAGASLDDVFVIVLFSSFLSLNQGGSLSALSFLEIPFSILLGALAGIGIGFLLNRLFKKLNYSSMEEFLILFSAALLLVWAEDILKGHLELSSLIGVMVMGMMIRMKNEEKAFRLSSIADKCWVPAEIFLFVLLGACVDVSVIPQAGLNSVILILVVLIFRMIGVWISLTGLSFDNKEKIFCMIAYTPKATVQAAIGGIPLAIGLPCGPIILIVSVLSILITAPLGAFGIDISYPKLLKQEKNI